MGDPDPAKILNFTTAAELGRWLKEHHEKESELWIKIFKKHSGVPSVDWNDVVIESLCWGWIDGIKKTIDETAYLQRITPRNLRSSWSQRNREHVERLIDEGRMQESGLAAVRAAKEDGRWEKAYAVRDMKIPPDFLAAVKQDPTASRFFERLTKTSRYAIALGLTSAKRTETRERRFAKYLDKLRRGEKPGF
ncbi:YdeI/OmpD-associated family protein [Spirochaeta lutea]|uniref:Bacteriocin-protection protein, YdeI/OmpD-associated family n=1 Tax=Spirochaeta lutea TaxID=1480694 RepID=A0A098R3J9_9SPIO|nr:YdeI/OmpD-associated family protein [Spirochaeta lutea]KGE73292.1 hypothetical protein DC28_04820 [Spirochaeta lutea]